MAVEDNVDQLVFNTFFPNRKDGVFVEIGAARPDYLSVSERFRHAGWKIIAVEPNPEFCAQHLAKGYAVHQYACGSEDKDEVEFFVVDSQGVDYLGGKVTAESFSSLGIKDEFEGLYKGIKDKSSIKKIHVKLRKLDTILATHEPQVAAVDVVCVDVEGWELTVLSGFSLEKYKPSVVILENIFRKPEYAAYMQSNGYALWLGLGLNEVYIRTAMQSVATRAAALRAGTLYRIAHMKDRVLAKIERNRTVKSR